ncbi:hypothetical protein MCHI_001429 [Candidatus Magnetoovum chiemensis]|nr:hypothetical protein MCHI_001429 [Candidatus Magnetoovum chiemensis]
MFLYAIAATLIKPHKTKTKSIISFDVRDILFRKRLILTGISSYS